MQWKPGQSGNPHGRPKKLMKRPEEVLHEQGISPVEEILKLIDAGTLRPSDQLKAWLELLAYCHAKPREFVAETDTMAALAKMSTTELLDLVAAKMPLKVG